MNNFRLFLLMLAIGFSSITHVFAYDNCSEGSKKCSLAVFPHSNFKQLLITYKSLLDDLTLILNSRVKFVSARTMTDYGYQLDKKAYDIALVAVGQYVSHGHPTGYIPLARRDAALVMQLFVKSDSHINSYLDLKGQKLSLMPEDTTTWYVTKILLKINNISINDVDFVALGSQQACAHALAINKVDACVFAVSNLGIIQLQNVDIDVRPIGEALSVPSPVYAVNPKLPQQLVDEIKSYLLSREGFIEVNDNDFDEFRSLISTLNE